MDRLVPSRSAGTRRSRVTFAAAAVACASMLSACVVQPYQPEPPTPYPAPPPQPQYAPPPQPEYAPAPQTEYAPPPESYAPSAEPEDPYAGEVAWTAPEPPPPLPVYEQPPCPADGYLWTPGYWAWSPAGYYWVPGTWVLPPAVGLLWTPGYWAFVGGVYAFHAGYWGPHVGYYGGVNYGFGYVGVGFVGGRWEGDRFAYNRSVVNVNETIVHNTYNQTVINNNITVNRVSYNGGPNGVHAAPTAEERNWSRERHMPPTQAQFSHVEQANRNPALFAHANGGRPPIAATPRPTAFTGPGVIGAHGASPLITQPGRGPSAPVSLPPPNRGAAPSSQLSTGGPAAHPPSPSPLVQYPNRVAPPPPQSVVGGAAGHTYQSPPGGGAAVHQGPPQGGPPKIQAQPVQPNAYVANPQAQYAHPPRPSSPLIQAPRGGNPPPPPAGNQNKGNGHPEKHEGEGGH